MPPAPPQTERKFSLVWVVIGIVALLLVCSGVYVAWTWNQIPSLANVQGDNNVVVNPAWLPVAQAGDKTFYSISGGTVYYKYLYKFLYTPDSKGDTYSNAPVPPADANSFLVSTQDYRVAKDNAHVFYAGAVVQGADPKSYELIPAENGKTYNLINGNFLPLSEVDKPYYPYAKDNSGVYCGAKKIADADPATFQPILTSSDLMNIHDPGYVLGGTRVAKDKNGIYLDCGSDAKVIPGQPQQMLYDITLDENGGLVATQNSSWNPDPTTFVALDDWYFKDKNNVYELGAQTRIPERLVYADPSTFDVFDVLQNSDNSEWAKDTQHVYDYGQIVSGANPATFAVSTVDPSYATDGGTLFYSTASEYLGTYESYKGVDSTTLQILSSGYAKDKIHVFFKANVLDGVDPASVDFLNYRGYIKDKNSVFLVHESDLNPIPPLAEMVNGADVATFTAVQGNGYDAQDKNHKYFQGKVVE